MPLSRKTPWRPKPDKPWKGLKRTPLQRKFTDPKPRTSGDTARPDIPGVPVAPALKRTRLKSQPHVIPPEIRREVEARSRGVCEACGEDRGEHLHHRLPRSRGGRDTVHNLIHVSFRCHRKIHANPRWAHERGLLISPKLDARGAP